MSCMSAKITRVGKIGASSELVSEGIRAGMTRAGAMTASFSMVCTPSIRTPYLEIEPTILWVYPDLERTNDVFSNTYWNIK